MNGHQVGAGPPNDSSPGAESGATTTTATKQVDAADPSAEELDLAALLKVLGYAEGEYVSVGHKVEGAFTAAVLAPSNVTGFIATLPLSADIYFGVNPVAGPARVRAGRGTAADVTRLAAVWADLDVKPEGCPDLGTAWDVIDDLSAIVGTRPSAVTHSGHGLHPYWPISDGQPGTGALLRRWGRLVAVVAEKRGAGVDSVFDLARMLRVPGTINPKGCV